MGVRPRRQPLQFLPGWRRPFSGPTPLILAALCFWIYCGLPLSSDQFAPTATKVDRPRQEPQTPFTEDPSVVDSIVPNEDAAITIANATPPQQPVPRYVVYRIIGNDLPPQHSVGHSYDNLKFILEHEPVLENCEKRWLLNRIALPREERRIIQLLTAHNQSYTRIPFVLEDYAKTQFRFHDFRHPDPLRSIDFWGLPIKIRMLYMDDIFHDKILYVTNVNGARNAALQDGKQSGFEWILPMDGNIFLTARAWANVQRTVARQGLQSKYFVVPTAMVYNRTQTANADFRPPANDEPQILFRNDSLEAFNETYRYGRRTKVELLWRLGVPGQWDAWPKVLDWENIATSTKLSQDVSGRGTVLKAGWAARLSTGKPIPKRLQSVRAGARAVSRSQSVQELVKTLDARVARDLYNFTQSTLMAFNEKILAREKEAYLQGKNKALSSTCNSLVECAKMAMTYGPWSVMDKTEYPPSHNKHDYYTPKPYYWPDPSKPDGLPYIRRDGQRVPGTELYGQGSEKFDRTRLAAMTGNTTCLGLAWYFTGNKTFADKAADNIRTWFLNPETCMTPHIRYAQIWWGNANNEGKSTGVIEFKDYYYFLDAVRLVYRAGSLTDEEMQQLKQWFELYAKYLDTSNQGKGEYLAPNNHGTFFDLQRIAVAAFVNNAKKAVWIANTARGRLLSQFAKDGSLPEEMIRRTQLHYMMFTLSGWYKLAQLAERLGVNLWSYTTPDDPTPILLKGATFTVPQLSQGWRHPQSRNVDMGRMWPLFHTAIEHYPDMPVYRNPVPYYKLPPFYHVHDGLQLFWNLGLAESGLDGRSYNVVASRNVTANNVGGNKR